ncbi:MAG: triose-phosphate isomerase, partial [Nitrospiraceae bacterium]
MSNLVRRRLVVGNWKMNKTATEAALFVDQFSEVMPQAAHVEVVLAPPFTALHAVRQAAGAAPPFGLAGQNVFWEEKGAFTGEISAPMLKDVGCRYVIIGHSERRQWFGDTDEGINKKIRAALRHGLLPILCLGESLADRESGRTHTIVIDQLQKNFEGLSKEEILMAA